MRLCGGGLVGVGIYGGKSKRKRNWKEMAKRGERPRLLKQPNCSGRKRKSEGDPGKIFWGLQKKKKKDDRSPTVSGNNKHKTHRKSGKKGEPMPTGTVQAQTEKIKDDKVKSYDFGLPETTGGLKAN